MKEVSITIVIVVSFVGFILLCAWMYPSMTEVKQMNCAMAEFSPDVTTEIKQLCREARRSKT
tara:strand:- start:432 stop:617 length:186 start_codon:yes stop_codon:yes gene_type:complete